MLFFSTKTPVPCVLSLFPAVIEPFPSSETTEEYLGRCVNPILLRGLIELCKEKPLNPRVSTDAQYEEYTDVRITV